MKGKANMASVNRVILCGGPFDGASRLQEMADRFMRPRLKMLLDNLRLEITNGLPEQGGGGASADVDCEGGDSSGAAPAVAASDDDEGGDDDGEPARSCPHSKPSNPPAPGSASKKHHGLTRSRTRHQAEKTPEIKTIAVGEFELAESIGMSVEFLRKDRSGKRLIPFYRIGTAIRYNPTRVGEALMALEQGGYAPKPKASKARQSNLTAG